MSKVITSKSKIWTGTISLYERFTLPQVELVEDALLTVLPVNEGKVRLTHIDKPRLPALLACVEKWDLKDFPDPVTVETFPLTPRRPAHELIEWIFDEIRIIYNGEIEIPNG